MRNNLRTCDILEWEQVVSRLKWKVDRETETDEISGGVKGGRDGKDVVP